MVSIPFRSAAVVHDDDRAVHEGDSAGEDVGSRRRGEIMHLVDMHGGVTSEGWTRETARLFAIDTAMTFIRRNMAVLSEADKHSLVTRLQEARTLVVSGRDSELGFIQVAPPQKKRLPSSPLEVVACQPIERISRTET